VPRDFLEEALALFQHAPSNSYIHPWQIVFASGAAMDRLKGALLDTDAARRGVPNLPAPPEACWHRAVNRLHIGREVIEKRVIFLEDGIWSTMGQTIRVRPARPW
jgi:hypothetical protein